MMNGREKSDGLIVPTKLRNKAGRPAADAVEGRGPTEGNSSQQNATRTQCRISASNALERVRQAASRALSRQDGSWPAIPKVRAGCRNTARPDLCGGRPARAAPTAIVGPALS